MLFKDILNNVDDITTGFRPVLSFSFATFSVGMFFELFFEKQRISVSCAVRQLQKKNENLCQKSQSQHDRCTESRCRKIRVITLLKLLFIVAISNNKVFCFRNRKSVVTFCVNLLNPRTSELFKSTE